MPVVAGVTLVVAAGRASQDRYGEALAERLAVDVVRIDKVQAGTDRFGLRLLDVEALRSITGAARTAGRLRRASGLVHLTHHHLGRYGPWLRRPFLLTVHDLIRWWDGRLDSPLIRTPTRADGWWLGRDHAAIASAAGIITPSAHTRDQLVEHLGVPADRVVPVPMGVDLARFRPVPQRLVEGRYVLFVGSEHPRKEVPTLLDAVARLRRQARFSDVRLVKVGAAGSGEDDFRAPTTAALRRLRLGDAVVFTGEVSDADLPAYYSHAACFVLASRAEGFGIPPLEAMACGAPVVVSTAGALPEVTGDAALHVPPGDAEALATAIASVLDDADRRDELCRRGRKRAAQYSWDRTAIETASVYERFAR